MSRPERDLNDELETFVDMATADGAGKHETIARDGDARHGAWRGSTRLRLQRSLQLRHVAAHTAAPVAESQAQTALAGCASLSGASITATSAGNDVDSGNGTHVRGDDERFVMIGVSHSDSGGADKPRGPRPSTKCAAEKRELHVAHPLMYFRAIDAGSVAANRQNLSPARRARGQERVVSNITNEHGQLGAAD